jgi:hypothetical protein
MLVSQDAIQLALEIAEDDCRSVIDCNGMPVRSKSGALLWYEVDPKDETSWWYVERALRYLKMRGMLRIRRSNPNHVKVRP